MTKMNKLTLAAAIAAVSAGAFAEPETQVYGKAHYGLASWDVDGDTFSQIDSYASRLGFKGFDQINEDTQVIFQYEFEQIGDDEDNGSAPLKARNTFVGLKGKLGEITVGRNDTALKKAQGKADLFNDVVDIKALFEGENREGDIVSYASPSFSGMKVLVSHVVGQDHGAGDGQSFAVTYGDKKLKKSNLYASVAMDSEIDSRDVMRLTGQYKMNDITLGFMYQTQEKTDGTDKGTGMMVNGKYKMGDYNLKLQYQMLDNDDDAVADPTFLTLGAETKLAKSTKVHGFYSMMTDWVPSAPGKGTETDGINSSYLGLAVEYKF